MIRNAATAIMSLLFSNAGYSSYAPTDASSHYLPRHKGRTGIAAARREKRKRKNCARSS